MSAATPAERAKAYRDRQRGGPARAPAPCGTRSAAARHRRNGEPIDDACAQAERDYMNARNADKAKGD